MLRGGFSKKKGRTKLAHRLVAMFVLVATALPYPALAAFNANNLLSDFELWNGDAMSRSGIQNFLTARSGALSRQRFDAIGGQKSAADIIFDAGKYYGISQKFLLALLQKEQSLVTAQNPSQRAYDFAMGYGCFDGSGCDGYRGFFNQVNFAARQIKNGYLGDLTRRGYTVSGFGPGITKFVNETYGDSSGQDVTPVNNATAALYTYTPFLHGNRVFTNIWTSWFARIFPNGALLHESGTSNYYLIKGGIKRKFRSYAVLTSRFDPSRIIEATPEELTSYDSGSDILFSDLTLIRSPRGTVFLVLDGQRRGFDSQQTFQTLGFNKEEIRPVSWDDLNTLTEGAHITMASAHPVGALLQSKTTGGIAYVENGVRHTIYSREILKAVYGNRKPVQVPNDQLESFPLGDPIVFPDGVLVTARGERSVFFVSDGMKRPVASLQTFDTLGFHWKNVIWTDSRSLSLLPTGDPLDTTVTE